MAPASHFARLSYEWGVRTAARKSGHIQGSLAIATAELGAYALVFDAERQQEIDTLQERGILRRSGHTFHTQRQWSPTSYLVYGEITEGGYSSSFIGVEAHAYGAVSVYFREYIEAIPIDELIGWWLYTAWEMALEVHQLIGTTGPADVVALLDPNGVSGIKSSGLDSPASFLHGPVSLSNEETDPQMRRIWAYRSAKAGIRSLRSEIVPTSDASQWNPDEVRQRLAYGRRTDSSKR